MELKPIKTESEYQQALQRIEELFMAQPNTKEGDELDILGMLIEHYEEEHFPIEMPQPIEAIKFRMEQMGLVQQDLTKIIGSKSRASEILHQKRPLSLRQIRLLHKELHIPAEVLLKEY